MMGGSPAEHGETVVSFTDYKQAQSAVSKLIEADIPTKDIQIVGRGLRSVETVTGRLGYAAAARSGAINGILLGLLFSAIFILGTEGAQIQLFIGVMLVGIAVGMILSLLMYSLLRRRRDYTSITQVIADHYDVAVSATSFARAREALNVQSRTTVARPPAAAEEPPRYGERTDPLPPPQYGERVDPAPEGQPVEPSEPTPGDPSDPGTDSGGATPPDDGPDPSPVPDPAAEPEPGADPTGDPTPPPAPEPNPDQVVPGTPGAEPPTAPEGTPPPGSPGPADGTTDR